MEALDKRIEDYINKESDFVNDIVGNDNLFRETLWVICEDYHRMRREDPRPVLEPVKLKDK